MGGPVGEDIARIIELGYTDKATPYHGYFFKVLKGQGPAAPLGEMDFVVKGVMIGGFALVAVPAEYRVTGVKTFIVSHDGVVYEKDLGDGTLERPQDDGTLQPGQDLEARVRGGSGSAPIPSIAALHTVHAAFACQIFLDSPAGAPTVRADDERPTHVQCCCCSEARVTPGAPVRVSP